MRVSIVQRGGKPWAVDFECPGCGLGHLLPVSGWQDNDGRASWGFDGNVDRPTLSPSILYRIERNPPSRSVVCHSFVRDGRIEFLSDCTHALAGKTVDLPEISE